MCIIHLFVCLLFSRQGAKTVNPTLRGKEKQIIQCLSLVAAKASSLASVPELVQIHLWGAKRTQVQTPLLLHVWKSRSRPAGFRKPKFSSVLGTSVGTDRCMWAADHLAFEPGCTPGAGGDNYLQRSESWQKVEVGVYLFEKAKQG